MLPVVADGFIDEIEGASKLLNGLIAHRRTKLRALANVKEKRPSCYGDPIQ